MNMKKMNELTLKMDGDTVLCGGESISRDFYNKIILSRSREILRVKKEYRKEKAPLCAALSARDEKSVEALLDGGEDPKQKDKNGFNALHRATQGCSIPLFERILNSFPSNPNVQEKVRGGKTPLMVAAMNNKVDIVITLMNHPRIDVNFRDNGASTALHYAVEWNRPAIVAQLLSDDRVDSSIKDCNDRTPFVIAMHYEYEACACLFEEWQGGLHFW